MKAFINKDSVVSRYFPLRPGYMVLLCILLLPSTSCNKTTCDNMDDKFPYSCTNGMDVAFLIDYTGSMGGAIDNIKTSVASIVSTIITRSANDYRLSLSIFDEMQKNTRPAYFTQAAYTSLPAANKIINSTGVGTEQYLTMMESFGTMNNASFSTQLAKLNSVAMPLGNGIGFAEPGGMLLDRIVNSSFAGAWRPSKTKLAIIITDAPDGGDDDNNDGIDDAFLANLATQANAKQIQCILVTSLPSSNYSVKLIAGNTHGLQLLSANFANIATDINKMIDQLCINNSK